MNSEKNKAWLSDIMNRKLYDASIDSNSSTHNLGISFSGYNNGTKIQRHLLYQVDLRDYFPEQVKVGFSAATGIKFEVHALLPCSFCSNLEIEETATPSISPIAPSQLKFLQVLLLKMAARQDFRWG